MDIFFKKSHKYKLELKIKNKKAAQLDSVVYCKQNKDNAASNKDLALVKDNLVLNH